MGVVLSLDYFRRAKAEHNVFCHDGKTYTRLPGNVVRARRCDWCARKELVKSLQREYAKLNNSNNLEELVHEIS